jgi:hypothetical protein
MNVTAHCKSTGLCKSYIDILARPLFRRVKTHVFGIDIDLMKKFVLVGEADRVSAPDLYLMEREIAALLSHRMDRRGNGGRGHYCKGECQDPARL